MLQSLERRQSEEANAHRDRIRELEAQLSHAEADAKMAAFEHNRTTVSWIKREGRGKVVAIVGGGWWLLVVGIWWKAEVVLVAMHASGSEGMAGVVVVVAETPSCARVVIVGAA